MGDDVCPMSVRTLRAWSPSTANDSVYTVCDFSVSEPHTTVASCFAGTTLETPLAVACAPFLVCLIAHRPI